MKRSAKVLWVGFVFCTIVIAAVAGLVIYFTAFKRTKDSSNSPVGNTTSSDPSDVPIGPGTNSEPENNAESPDDGNTPSDDSPPTIAVPGDGDREVSLVDHLSHSVPGFVYRAVDFDGDGFAVVKLDGTRSHTHYYDEGPPIVVGKIDSMVWFLAETMEEIGTGATPEVTMPVGKTKLGLTVCDNFRDCHTDYTNVIVEEPVEEGAYCYYYPRSGSGFTISDSLDEGMKPTYAAFTDRVAFEDDSSFPAPLRGTEFQARCVFTVTSAGDPLKFSVEHMGPVRLLVGNKVALESDSSDLTTTEGSVEVDAGDHDVHLLYNRINSAGAKLDVLEGGGNIDYDMSEVLPVITTIDPISSTLDGGGEAKILGIGLRDDIKVSFGDQEVEVDTEKSNEEKVFFTVPESDKAGVVEITVTTSAGTSNALQFQFSTAGKPPIKFKESRVVENGKPLELDLLTGIVYGPDHRYYVSAINHRVHSFAADSNMQVSDRCTSGDLGEHKAILGLAFNPMDTEVKLYVSASILDWKLKEKLSGKDAWANGEILLLRKDFRDACLHREEEPVITGLPVSNHDHGINGMVFDNDGILHMQIGGFTNAGHNVADSRLGGIDENPLSGASIYAEVGKPGFDGKITYKGVENPGTAVQVSGDVHVWSPGWRNSFGIATHSNGYLYATDNGASVGFGDMSTSCSTFETLDGESLDDKLGKVVKGKYAGHANRNRGRFDKDQCKFRYPGEPSAGNYLAPIATFESSTNGVMEYTADVFAGQMKGDLLCTKYSTQDSAGKVFRVQLDGSGNLKAGPDEMWTSSGLSVTMSPWGQLLMPRVYKAEIITLTPTYNVGIVPMFIAVMPFRGPQKGGNVVMVTGENLGSEPTARFGEKTCTEVTEVAPDGRSFKCKVPAGSGGVQVTLVLDNGSEVASTGGKDYVYMNG